MFRMNDASQNLSTLLDNPSFPIAFKGSIYGRENFFLFGHADYEQFCKYSSSGENDAADIAEYYRRLYELQRPGYLIDSSKDET